LNRTDKKGFDVRQRDKAATRKQFCNEMIAQLFENFPEVGYDVLRQKSFTFQVCGELHEIVRLKAGSLRNQAKWPGATA